ncbi:MAG: hypothetical protein KKH88_03685 [Nanoarchaeota archaeon]|nr:hypothetical protein [Nanoarchaeota archaeon]
MSPEPQEQEQEKGRDELHSELSDMLVCGNDPSSMVLEKARNLVDLFGYVRRFDMGYSNPLEVYTKTLERDGRDVFMAAEGNVYHAHLVGETQIKEFAKLLWGRNNGTRTGPNFGRKWAYSIVETLAIGGTIALGKAAGLDNVTAATLAVISGGLVGIGECFHYLGCKNKARDEFNELSAEGDLAEGKEALEKIK